MFLHLSARRPSPGGSMFGGTVPSKGDPVMLNVVLSVVITLAVLGLLRLARRAAWCRHRGPASGWMARRLARRLGATPEQERLLREEVEALRLAVAELRGDLFASREDLARALAAERLDQAALDAVAARGASRL